MPNDQKARIAVRSPYLLIGVVLVLVGLGLPIVADSTVSGVAFTVSGFVVGSMAYRRRAGDR